MHVMDGTVCQAYRLL